MIKALRTTDVVLHIYRNPDEMAEETARILLEQCEGAIRERGVCTIALSGGQTPLPLFDLLAKPEWSNRFPWEKISFYWVDEHCVPVESPLNNYTIAKRRFLSKTWATRFYRIRGELPVQEAVALYDDMLKQHFNLNKGDLPRFDIIMLGVGIAGYVASIYPNSNALCTNELVTEVNIEGERHSRITLTMPVINNARCVIFMVSGKHKAPVLQKALDILAQPSIPPQFVRPTRGKLIWNVDEEAATMKSE